MPHSADDLSSMARYRVAAAQCDSQGNAGPPQVSLTPAGGGRRMSSAWGRSRTDPDRHQTRLVAEPCACTVCAAPADPPGCGPSRCAGSLIRAAMRCRCAATFGSGRRRTVRPAPAFAPAPSANTTPSSCATNSCCVAAPAPRRQVTCVRATATSSRPRRSGSSAGCGWRATPEAGALKHDGTSRS